MTPTELLRLENIFIKLKGDKMPFDQIRLQFPTVGEDLLNQWEFNFNAAAAELPNGPQIFARIIGKSEDGRYMYGHEVKMASTFLERAKFELWQMSTHRYKDDELTPDRLAEYRGLVSESADHLQTMTKYFTELSVQKVKGDEFVFNFTLNTDDEVVTKASQSAIAFYHKWIFSSHVQAERLQAIHSRSVDIFKIAEGVMPYAIKQFRIINYKGVLDAYVTDIPIDTKWIFITGENGFGKTSILQALVIGLFGERDNDRVLFDSANSNNDQQLIGVEYKAGFQNVLNNIHDRTFKPIKNLVCYGPSRLRVQSNQTQNDASANSSVTYPIFNPDGVLLNIEYSLLIWYLKEDIRFTEVKKLFRRLIPFLADIRIENDKVLYVEKDPEHENALYFPVQFDSLASGARSVIAMVGDMIIRLFENQKDVLNPSDLQGIAIIDELDLHWHPKLQRELPHTLSEIFPYIQFIATTHSVIPFLGAPEQSVFLKVNRSHEKGITIERIDMQIQNLLPNILLTSSLFDMDKITQINNENLADVRTEDNMDDMVSNQEREARLRDFEKSNKEFPDKLFN